MSSTSDSVLESLSEDVRSFYALREIKRMHEPSAAEFLRHAVSCHQPVIITGLLDDWKAMEKWETTEGFLNSCPEQVNVNLTPDGRADSIQAQADGEDGEDYFVTPAETSLNSRLFMDMLENPIEGDAVAYLSQQNDNLRATMPTLLDDCAPSLPLADSVFLGDALLADKPEAINLWVGTEKSVSSTHKDYFENMYAVVRGEKTFTLFPPTDIIFLPNKKCKSRAYKYNGPNTHTSLSRPSQADLQLCEAADNAGSDEAANEVSWISLDPEDPDAHQKHPRFKLASPLRITVRAGETLYLPAMWLHRVSQTCLTISVNYWYDMRFDLRFCFYNVIQKLNDMAISDMDRSSAIKDEEER